MRKKENREKGRRTILSKVLLVYLLTAALPLFTAGIVYTRWLADTARQDIIRSQQQLLGRSMDVIGQTVERSMAMGRVLASSPSIHNLLERAAADAEIVTAIKYEVLPLLASTRATEPDSNIRLIHTRQALPQVYDVLVYQPQLPWGSDGEVFLGDGAYAVGVGEDDRYFPDIQYTPGQVLFIRHAVLHSFGLERLGYVEITYPLQRLMEQALDGQFPEGTHVALQSGERVLWATGGTPDAQGTSIAADGLAGALSLSATLPKQAMAGQSVYTTAVVMLVLALSIAGVAMAIFFLIMKRLNLNTRALTRFRQGEFGLRIPVQGNDELAFQASAFNSMAERIEGLIRDLDEARDAERQAMYTALVNRVRPHFLNNALDSLRMSASLQNQTELSRKLEAIIHYLNYSIGSLHSFVSLEEELRSVVDYLAIYNLARDVEIDFQLLFEHEIRESLKEFFVPKFTLQPIVENSIRHGLMDKEAKRIFLMVQYDDDMISISLEDNGAGISEERLLALRQSLEGGGGPLQGGDGHAGIGLGDIQRRLTYHYGDRARVLLDSYVGVGTIVTVQVPRQAGPVEQRGAKKDA